MIGQTNRKIITQKLQRTLRKNMTDAEQALWVLLRGRQFAGLKFRRQHPFDNYILDFVCLSHKLVIEVDGSQHSLQTDYDEDRAEKLGAAGFRQLRFWNNEVLEEREAVAEKILVTIRELTPSPPRPSP